MKGTSVMLFSDLRSDMVLRRIDGKRHEYHVEHLGRDHAILRTRGDGYVIFVEPDHPLLLVVEPNGLLA
jgi:hypothetical protein